MQFKFLALFFAALNLVTSKPTDLSERSTDTELNPPSTLLPSHVVLTALVGKDGLSALECWSLQPGLSVSNQSGTVGALGFPHMGATTAASSWTLFPTLMNAGLHNGPAPQWVMVMTGRGELSFPLTTDPNDGRLGGNYTLHAGEIIIVTDTKDVSVRGHNTVWQAGSIALQFPFADAVVPDHNVLHTGGCTPSDLVSSK